MKVVAIASQKGGTGKTTLAAHLAAAAKRAGAGLVGLLDTGGANGLEEWRAAREADDIRLVATDAGRLWFRLKTLRADGADFAVVDTPPADGAVAETAMAVADLVLIPVRPGAHELRAALKTAALAEKADKPFVFVVNGATRGGRMSEDMVAALAEHGPVAPLAVGGRDLLAEAMIDGNTAFELAPNGRAAREIARLYDFIAARLDKVAPRSRVVPFRRPAARKVFGQRGTGTQRAA
jgi:chromosome partitioning protein